jgi:hypothetical protein
MTTNWSKQKKEKKHGFKSILASLKHLGEFITLLCDRGKKEKTHKSKRQID